jgi:hypothetical protein
MNSSLFSKAFILKATACIKAANTVSQGSGLSLPELEQPVINDLGNGLCVVYLVEADEGLVYVQNRHMQESGFTLGALHELGIVNLMERSDDKATFKQYGPVYGAHLDGMFEASLILRDDLWDDMMAHLAPNGFVAGLPARDVLGVCDAKSAEGIAGLKKMVASVSASANERITTNLYRREKGQWVVMN